MIPERMGQSGKLAQCYRRQYGTPFTFAVSNIGKPIGLTLDQFFTPPNRLTYPGR